MPRWISDQPVVLLEVAVTALIFYITILITSKLAGIRSFTKASGFDFIITLSIGALLATTVIDKNISILEGTVSIISLYALQTSVAYARRHWSFVNRYIDNQPILLMEHGKFIEKNMKKAHITRQEVRSKIRNQDVNSYSQIRAVILEPSGSVSVIKHDPNNPLDPSLLEGVRT